jgi:methionine synthase II (cobalamin-independent)
MTTIEAIEKIADTARQVGKAHDRQAGAWTAAIEARAKLLDGVLEAVRPAIAAIVSRVPRSGAVRTVTDYFEWKGIQVDGDAAPGIDARQLVLNDQGTLVELVFAWEGKKAEWIARWCPVTSRHAVGEYDLARVVRVLGAALVAQAGGKSAMTTAVMLTKAHRLEAIATLLQDGQS